MTDDEIAAVHAAIAARKARRKQRRPAQTPTADNNDQAEHSKPQVNLGDTASP
ncbi:hypothetical protein [Mycolicibacterium holsaticum]|uniref:hypothetical protein n=1 Tax=Mycolicibacterium holsaticum TaxID=152142 RepID=UPI0013F4E686|nr:hypothetical protein [Mycolicibacterium holsaticum]